MIFTTSAEAPLLCAEMFLSSSAGLRVSTGSDGAPPIDSILGHKDQNRKGRRSVCVCVSQPASHLRVCADSSSISEFPDRATLWVLLQNCESFHEAVNQSNATVNVGCSRRHCKQCGQSVV